MLVLTRKPGEQVIIADNIRITVVSVGPGRVKIGIEAPPTVKVDRQEVHEKKQFETTAAAADVPVPHVIETKPLLHNRIATKLPPAERPLSRRFPPRKPR